VEHNTARNSSENDPVARCVCHVLALCENNYADWGPLPDENCSGPKNIVSTTAKKIGREFDAAFARLLWPLV